MVTPYSCERQIARYATPNRLASLTETDSTADLITSTNMYTNGRIFGAGRALPSDF